MAKNYMSPIPCPLCGSKNFKILFKSTLAKSDFAPEIIRKNVMNSLNDYGKHGQFVLCKKCGVVYENPQEDFSSLLKGYNDVVDEEYLHTEKFRKILLRQHLKILEQFKARGNLLDIGCFAGYFLELAKKNGWKTYGIEPSKWASAIAKGRGIEIVGAETEKTILSREYYDAITLWDVIEHLPNPIPVLKKLHTSLKPDGIIALGTPNIESIAAKILGKRNPALIRMHLVLYSPKTLKHLLEQCGYTVIHTQSYGRVFPLYYVLDRLQFNNSFFNIIRNTVNHIPFIANLAIPIYIGDAFVMVARKKS